MITDCPEHLAVTDTLGDVTRVLLYQRPLQCAHYRGSKTGGDKFLNLSRFAHAAR